MSTTDDGFRYRDFPQPINLGRYDRLRPPGSPPSAVATDTDEPDAHERVAGQVQAIANRGGLHNVGVNDMTPDVWRSMSKAEQDAWHDHQKTCYAICMLGCGFPVHFPGAPCEACEPDEFKAWSGRHAREHSR